MANLPEILTDESKRAAVVEDCLVLIDEEVADKGGMSGMAIKAGYKTVKGVKPGFLRGAVDDLLPEFAQALDPIYQESVSNADPVDTHFVRESDRVADALLAITDAKAERAKNRIVKGAYDRLRGQAKKHVISAVPRLGRLVAKYTAA